MEIVNVQPAVVVMISGKISSNVPLFCSIWGRTGTFAQATLSLAMAEKASTPPWIMMPPFLRMEKRSKTQNEAMVKKSSRSVRKQCFVSIFAICQCAEKRQNKRGKIILCGLLGLSTLYGHGADGN